MRLVSQLNINLAGTGKQYTKSYHENAMIFKEMTFCFVLNHNNYVFHKKNHIVFSLI